MITSLAKILLYIFVLTNFPNGSWGEGGRFDD